MNDNKKEVIENKEFQNNLNSISNPYRRMNDNYIPSEKKNSKNILINTGEELIIKSRNALTNKYSHKSIFSQSNINNKKLKRIYNPYLISACKRTIIKEKKQLQNYEEVIRKINTEFGIEEIEKQNFGYSPKNKKGRTINIEADNMK